MDNYWWRGKSDRKLSDVWTLVGSSKDVIADSRQ